MPKHYSKQFLKIQKLEHLSLRLNISIEELNEVASIIKTQYKIWDEPKESGGIRTISAPKPRLKKIQTRIHKLLQEVKIHNAAYCGIKKRSTLSNASIHSGQKWVYKLDFSNFFPSISPYQVYNLFLKELKCSPEVSSLLSDLCTINGSVPQGGPMSMDIANLVCKTIDPRLSGLALKFGIRYTRYCDDISFSGKVIPPDFIKFVKKILLQSKFKLKDEKETLAGKDKPQIVTGISVRNRKLNLPRKKLKRWRAEDHIFNKYEVKELPSHAVLQKRTKIDGRSAYKNYVVAEGDTIRRD